MRAHAISDGLRTGPAFSSGSLIFVTDSCRPAAAGWRFSYKETWELDTIEQRIADAERELQAKHDVLQEVAVMSDGARLHAASLEMEAAQRAIDQLYARWAELEQKKN